MNTTTNLNIEDTYCAVCGAQGGHAGWNMKHDYEPKSYYTDGQVILTGIQSGDVKGRELVWSEALGKPVVR